MSDGLFPLPATLHLLSKHGIDISLPTPGDTGCHRLYVALFCIPRSWITSHEPSYHKLNAAEAFRLKAKVLNQVHGKINNMMVPVEFVRHDNMYGRTIRKGSRVIRSDIPG